MRWPILTALALVTSMLGAATAAEQGKVEETGRVLSPSINGYYLDADPEFWRETFERDGRELYDQRRTILKALALKPGQAVADVGAGSGLFSLLFAQSVGPTGRVYAVDISEPFTRAIAERAAQAGLDQLVTVTNDQHSLGLADDSVDLIFTADTYHHFEFPQAMLEAMRRALRPGGSLVIIDFRTDPRIASAWVQGHVRAGREQVIAEVESAGFQLEQEFDLLKRNFFLRFRALNH
ncbi:class I SAM-dependent methyltransferase [Thiorhodovibrio frisius]|uniref:Methylase involved in ubiquinone/menaquinone biosynthesis n=1 Tax=Thiorhodovibrio frisius TaxID=631362 RepID=H8Z1D8_9GAMM|nr:methyltransferase domain-containing protein [Thiorhodovibrio frisius]EIC22487.1 methylase involved in ubiquinone/menaquinone biosynthesis [Thiorhodovibrio frisius]WPL24788.1 Demethylmenaquinone methyltransferase [Thiorhodovibrio frisius]